MKDQDVNDPMRSHNAVTGNIPRKDANTARTVRGMEPILAPYDWSE
jgi:hypothetical protein